MNTPLMNTYKQFAEQTLEQARCLPFAVYHDPDVYEAEVSRIFHNDWIFFCPEELLADAGQYFAMEIAGEPVVVIRGRDGELRALSNSCRHRGTPLLDNGSGSISKNIVCPYHAWNFDDKGEFKGAPMTGEIRVEADKHCLPQYGLATWNGLIFVNLSETPQPFSEKIAGIDDYLKYFELSRFKHSYQLPEEHWQANWKLAVENGIESYHLFKVHKETLETVTPSKKAYYVAGSPEWTLTGGEMKDTRNTLSKWFSGSHPEVYSQYLLLFLPPSFVAVIDYEGLNWIHVLPDGAEGCRVTPGGLLEYQVKDFSTEEFQFTAAFLKEDQDICERVQRGMHARQGHGGKLISMECILVDFRQYLASRLFNLSFESFHETEKAGMFYK